MNYNDINSKDEVQIGILRRGYFAALRQISQRQDDLLYAILDEDDRQILREQIVYWHKIAQQLKVDLLEYGVEVGI